MNGKKIILKNGIVLTPFQKLYDKAVFLKNGKIEKLISSEELSSNNRLNLKEYEIIDAENYYISPGFIDIHIHGANNIDAVDGPYEPMSEFLVRYGTTGFLPTFWNTDIDKLTLACKKINKFIKNQTCKGAKILGINSEGPYLNPRFGAQLPERTFKPEFKQYFELVESAQGNLKLMTVSPEVPGSAELIKYLRLNDVTVAINYTDISVPELYETIKLGVGHIDHIFDGFGNSVSEEKGVRPQDLQEELLVCDNLPAEVIADRNGIHVSPALLKILIRCKGIENLILVTDSRDIAGNLPGRYTLKDGYTAIIKEGEDVVRLEDGTLAGCVMTMNESVRNMMEHTGIGLNDAVRMATCNPARILKISNKKGEIKEGMDADIVVFDKNIDIKLSIVDGEVIYAEL
jgi:N-acetylglucosamine-6-phosphate deacetylase